MQHVTLFRTVKWPILNIVNSNSDLFIISFTLMANKLDFREGWYKLLINRWQRLGINKKYVGNDWNQPYGRAAGWCGWVICRTATVEKVEEEILKKRKQFPFSIVALNRGGSSNISDIGSLYLHTDLVTIESWSWVSGRGQTIEAVQVRGSIRGLKWNEEEANESEEQKVGRDIFFFLYCLNFKSILTKNSELVYLA